MILVWIASKGLYSQAGTCLSAAACTTTVDAGERPLQAIYVAHVSDEIAQAGMIESCRPHFMLLQLVAAEDHQSLRVIVAQHDLDELSSRMIRFRR